MAAAALLAVPLARLADGGNFDSGEGFVVENPFVLGLGKAPFEGAEVDVGREPNAFDAPLDS